MARENGPVTPSVTALHMGALHPVEQLLTVVLAFGPFLVLAVVVVVRRRQDRREELAEATRETRENPEGQRDR